MASVRNSIMNGRSDRIASEPVNLHVFNERRNRLLIVRGTGGLGDILMHRMLFEDFKLLIPELEITFALPRNYWKAVEDHPFIDHIVDSNTVDVRDFLISYTTTTACGRHENRVAPLSDKHRSDIWGHHCGINLTRHNMHIRLRPEEVEAGKRLLNKHSQGRPVALIAPTSAMKSKNMDDTQMNGTARELRKMGFSPVCLHNTPVPEMSECPVEVVDNIRLWMGVIHASDLVVSVDTAVFHCAGGMKKPLVGMFTWADGLAYGKWFNFALVQKNRAYTPGWECGPCYKWNECKKCPELTQRKPCVTEISVNDIMSGVTSLFRRWPQMCPYGITFNEPPFSETVSIVESAQSQPGRLTKIELAVVAT
jgi:ADP-heptose:LPS heptosyltransferase